VDAADHHVQACQELRFLVERSVLVDVDLDPGQQAERVELGAQRLDLVELCQQPLR
jgi:hypothetical protein